MLRSRTYPTWGDGFPGYYPVAAPDAVEQYEDTFTKVIGRHTLAIGANLDFWQTKGVTDPFQANGLITFNGQYSSLAGEIPNVSTVSDLADMELGYPSGGNYTKNAIISNLVGGRWISLFAQDNIRVNSRFTVQAGLRWEYDRQPMDTNNQLAAFFPLSKTYQPGDALLLTALPDAANDALCSDPYFISATGECLVMTSGMRKAKGLNGNQSAAGELRAWSRIFCSASRPVMATDGFRQASASRRRWNIHEFARYESHGLVCQ